jgi:hypothetical protein
MCAMQLYLEMLRATGTTTGQITVDRLADFSIARRFATAMGLGLP